MTDKKRINLNLDSITHISMTGVRRAALFMGLGLNAASSDEFQDYQLHKIPKFPGQTALPIEILPAEASLQQVQEFKKEFEIWVVGNGLRELLEHYALSLDKVHEVALFVLLLRGKMTEAIADKEHTKFCRRMGVPDKLKTLKEKCSITVADSESVEYLYAARNCLVHDLGLVSPVRYNSTEGLILTWKTFDVFARGESTGKEIPVFDLVGELTTEDMMICGKVVSRQKKYTAGEKLVLSRQDLWEVCFFFKTFVIPQLMKSFTVFLETHDVPIRSAES